MAKEIVDVKVLLESEERVLRIQFNREEQQADTLFTVSSGSETLGVLRKNEDGSWMWAEGNRSYEDANVIGDEINAQV
jgi:hypothetical protein